MPTIAQQRLYSQGISNPRFQGPGDVVQWLGAVQAQDYASAEWTIGVRAMSVSPAQIQAAFADKILVRTWLLRGTLHIVPAVELGWMRRLLAPVLIDRHALQYRQAGLEGELLSKSYTAMEQALQGGGQRTRSEMSAVLVQAGIVLDGMRTSMLLNRAALDGIICLASQRGKQPTFTLLDEWLPQPKSLDRDEALATLALRYFTSHGPSTLHDFAWWTGLLVKDAKVGFDAVKADLIEEKRKGKSYWRSPSPVPSEEGEPSAYLLPGFDEFMLGYSDRSDFLEAQHKQKISGVNAVFAYTMVLDGQVAGIWKRTIRKGAVEITFLPFATLSPSAMNGFALAAQRYADFLGVRLA